MSIRRGNLVIAAKGIVRGDLFKTFVVDDTVATDFNSTNDEITITSSFVDLSGNTITLEQLSLGDNIIVKQLDVPDRYVMTKSGSSVKLGKLETTKVTIPTSINGFSGGSLTSPLVIRGGDGTNAAKIALDNTRSGQITDSSTKTIFGFLSNNATTLTAGSTDYALNLRGSGTRPQYKGNDLALYSDLPTITTTSGSESISDGTNTLNFGANAFTNTVIPTITATSGSESITDGTNTLNFGSNAFNSTPIPTVNDASLILQFNGNTLQTFTANASSNVTANIQALPNYSLTINHQQSGNPRQIKFLSINYANHTSEAATYIKLGAMSCHGNGSSYQFLDDIIIGCYYPGNIANPPENPTITCQVYKFVQGSCGTLDGAERNYGDVFYTVDTTNKTVDFYILGGQWSSSQYTPYTTIGSTVTTGITQYTGTAVYYETGTKNWANGNGGTYLRTSGGTLTGSLTLSSQDDALVLPNNAMLKTSLSDGTTTALRTIYGYDANADKIIVGSPYASLMLRGEGTRPRYNSDSVSLALYSDIPTNTVQSTDFNTSNQTKFGDYIVSKKKLLWSGNLAISYQGNTGRIPIYTDSASVKNRIFEIEFNPMYGDSENDKGGKFIKLMPSNGSCYELIRAFTSGTTVIGIFEAGFSDILDTQIAIEIFVLHGTLSSQRTMYIKKVYEIFE